MINKKARGIVPLKIVFDGVPIVDEKIHPDKASVNSCLDKARKKIL